MFFQSWAGLGRTALVGVLAYLALVVLLRVSGKRTLSKINALDLIVTVALGSTLATVLLSKTTSLAEGVTAFVLLIALQFVITWLSVRSPAFAHLCQGRADAAAASRRVPAPRHAARASGGSGNPRRDPQSGHRVGGVGAGGRAGN